MHNLPCGTAFHSCSVRNFPMFSFLTAAHLNLISLLLFSGSKAPQYFSSGLIPHVCMADQIRLFSIPGLYMHSNDPLCFPGWSKFRKLKKQCSITLRLRWALPFTRFFHLSVCPIFLYMRLYPGGPLFCHFSLPKARNMLFILQGYPVR